MADNCIKNLIEGFYNCLITDKSRYLELFSRLESQKEIWFVIELMHYFEQTQNIELTNENREASIEGKKVDLKIPINGQDFWIELKHIFVGKQKKDSYILSSYLHGKNYIEEDIEKIQQKENAYVLSFISTNNDLIRNRDDLEKQVNQIIERLKSRQLNAELVSSNYNKSCDFGYFLLNVSKELHGL